MLSTVRKGTLRSALNQYLMLVTSSALLRHFAAHLCDVVAHLIQEFKPSSRSARLNSD